MSTITASFPPSAQTTAPSSPIQIRPSSLPKRKTMSITQTYFLAHKARAKLSSEAGRPDHNLRLLVGHANLLDSLMLELADAEREQESWFNQSVRVASPSTASASAPSSAADKATPSRHVQWADTIVEDEEDEDDEDWNADDSDLSSEVSSDDYSEDDDEDESASSVEEAEDCEMPDAAVASATATSLRRVPSHISSRSSSPSAFATPAISVQVTPADDDDSDAEVDDDEEDYAQLTLTRSPSHSATAPSSAMLPASLPSPTSPPELVMEDSDVSSDEESMPPSPPVVTIGTFSPAQAADEHVDGSASPKQSKQQPATATKFDDDSSDHLYLPPRNPARLISNISVY